MWNPAKKTRKKMRQRTWPADEDPALEEDPQLRGQEDCSQRTGEVLHHPGCVEMLRKGPPLQHVLQARTD
jgi:hypothetical protein